MNAANHYATPPTSSCCCMRVIVCYKVRRVCMLQSVHRVPAWPGWWLIFSHSTCSLPCPQAPVCPSSFHTCSLSPELLAVCDYHCLSGKLCAEICLENFHFARGHWVVMFQPWNEQSVMQSCLCLFIRLSLTCICSDYFVTECDNFETSESFTQMYLSNKLNKGLNYTLRVPANSFSF